MVKARKYVVVKRFNGFPKRDDFEIVEEELPNTLKNGEILVKAEWISVDPYFRVYHQNLTVPYDQFGFQIGLVEDSKNPKFPVGTRVISHKGWCDYSIIDGNKGEAAFDRVYKLPALNGLSNSLGVGAVGMPGATAYLAFLDICQPKSGETVVVTGAAGAVGSLVGQIAKIKGCKVIGFAGSDEKVKWLEKDLGFDKAFNYKTVDVAEALKQGAPNGIDCYFDNVGGEISSIIINQMNELGRVVVVGNISSYNEDPTKMPKEGILQPAIVTKQLKIQGFLIWKWLDQWNEAFVEIVKLITSGKLKAQEHVTQGFENIFDAFSGMLSGDNFGKAVVKV